VLIAVLGPSSHTVRVQPFALSAVQVALLLPLELSMK
jgi:hypothetical protein